MPKVLNDLKKSEVCAILSVGCSRAVAARYVGCHCRTIAREVLRDAEFRARVLQAESSHEMQHLKSINEAAHDVKNWRAAVWMLERRYPQRYAARKPGTLSVDQVLELLDRLAAIVVDEVHDAPQREQILHRLREMTRSVPRDHPSVGAQPAAMADETHE